MPIRKAVNKDWPGIRALIAQYPKQLMQNDLPRAKSFMVAEMPTHTGRDKGIVGCCALEIYSPRIAEIRSLAVSKEWQGQGIGKKLVRACLALAKKGEVHKVLAITGKKEFFESFGFGTFNKERYCLFKKL